MSFSKMVKNEIASLEVIERNEKIAELSAFVRNNLDYNKEKKAIELLTENEVIARRLYNFFNECYEIMVQVTTVENLNFSKNLLYLITINDKQELILQDLAVVDKHGVKLSIPSLYIVGGDEEIRAYLRGCFLSCGSINDPKQSRYHMEMVINDPDEAIFIQKLLNNYEFNAKLLNRGKGYMVYIKEADKISDFLRLIKAYQAVLYFENARVYRDQKNRLNRLNNCEQANVDRVIETAEEQLKNISLIKEYIGLKALDDKLKEVIKYREKYPELSLQELSEVISLETGKKITKSGLNHRFRKISMIANDLKDKILPQKNEN